MGNMRNVFLDTNATFALLESDPKFPSDQFKHANIVLSPLSVHIFAYVRKINMPYPKLTTVLRQTVLVPLTTTLINKATSGPTHDLEDNIQLHSAAEANCDYFLTNDKNLLKLNYFGKTKIAVSLQEELD